MKPRIAFVGMTHLGLNAAVGSAARGFEVIGFDTDPARVAALASGAPHVTEPGLTELMATHHEALTFTSDASRLADCAVIYVAPDVPTDDKGQSDLRRVDALLTLANDAAAADATMVILSQVPPGFTRQRLGLRAHLYYQVETLIFGRAIERARNPERFIIGGADPEAPLPAPYRAYLDAFECPVLTMRYESAELAKIAINCCLVSSISVANMLADLCERIGADWREIVPALRLDRRIGRYSYIDPGLGVAGGNLERDLATVIDLAAAHGSDAGVAREWVSNSAYRKGWALRMLHEHVLSVQDRPTLGVLGLAYKENTHSTKNSPALALITALGDVTVRCFDPVVAPDPAWHPALVGQSGALEVCDGAQALAVMTPWPAFRALEPSMIAARLDGTVVIDPYGVLDAAACRAAGLKQIRLGAPNI